MAPVSSLHSAQCAPPVKIALSLSPRQGFERSRGNHRSEMGPPGSRVAPFSSAAIAPCENETTEPLRRQLEQRKLQGNDGWCVCRFDGQCIGPWPPPRESDGDEGGDAGCASGGGNGTPPQSLPPPPSAPSPQRDTLAEAAAAVAEAAGTVETVTFADGENRCVTAILRNPTERNNANQNPELERAPPRRHTVVLILRRMTVSMSVIARCVFVDRWSEHKMCNFAEHIKDFKHGIIGPGQNPSFLVIGVHKGGSTALCVRPPGVEPSGGLAVPSSRVSGRLALPSSRATPARRTAFARPP